MWFSVNPSRRIKKLFQLPDFFRKTWSFDKFWVSFWWLFHNLEFLSFFLRFIRCIRSRLRAKESPTAMIITSITTYLLIKKKKKLCNNHIILGYWKFNLRMVRFSSSEFAVTTWKSFVFSKLLLIIISKVLFRIPWKFFI